MCVGCLQEVSAFFLIHFLMETGCDDVLVSTVSHALFRLTVSFIRIYFFGLLHISVERKGLHCKFYPQQHVSTLLYIYT
jgi:hypothetical protein